MTLDRLIHRQDQLLVAVPGARLIHKLPRHDDQPLIRPQPSLLHLEHLPAAVHDPVEVRLLLVDDPAVLGVAGDGRVGEGPVVEGRAVEVGLGRGLEVAGAVVAAAVLVLREGVLHAVVVHEVGRVVVVVVVLVPPVVALQDLPGLDAVAAPAVLPVPVARRQHLSLRLGLVPGYGDVGVGLEAVGHAVVGGFAVAVRRAQVVAVRAHDGAFADEAGGVGGCQDSVVDLVAPASGREGGGEGLGEDGEDGEEEGGCRHFWMFGC